MEEHRNRYFLAAGCALALLLVSVQPAFSEAKPDGPIAGSGPDVIGLHIGTTLAEAQAIFKSRVLVSESLRKAYTEQPDTLGFFVPAQGVTGSVPNGKYLSNFEVFGRHEDGSMQRYVVQFAPVPGQEKIVSIYRSHTFSDSTKPTFDAFKKTLLEKYGTPTYVGGLDHGYAPAIFAWSYDGHGMLQKPGFIKGVQHCGNELWTMRADWGSMLQARSEFEQLPARCGDIYLRVEVNSPGQAGRETLATGYSVVMVGFDAAIRALKESRAIIDKAQADASGAAAKKGQQQKPDL